MWGCLGWHSGKECACQCRRSRRSRLDPRVRKISWRRKWQPTLGFLPGKILWTKEPGGVQSIGSQKSQTQLNTRAHEAVWQDALYFRDAVGSSLNTHSFSCGWVGFIGYQMKGFGQVSKSPFPCQKKEEIVTPHGVLGKLKEQCVKHSCHSPWHIVTATITVFSLCCVPTDGGLVFITQWCINMRWKTILATTSKRNSQVPLEMNCI